MARQGNSLAARIRRLEAAERQCGALKRGQVLTAEPMAKLLGVSWKTLRDWTRDLAGFEESGVFTRGAEGVNYEFKALATVRWLLKHFRAEHEARAKRARKLKQAVAGNALDDLPDDISLSEIRDLVRVAGELRAEQERRGQLVDAARVAQLVEAMLDRMLKAAIDARRQQDPSGQFPADVAEKFDSAFHAFILAQQQAATEVLNGLRGRIAQSG